MIPSPVLHHMQIDARIRQRAQTIRAVPGQVSAHVAAVRPEAQQPAATRARLRDDPAKRALFRARYRETFRKNENDRSVYFARLAETDAVKIGFARVPEKRMKALFDDYGVLAEIIGTIPGGLYEEQRVHSLFARAKVYHPRVPELFAYPVIIDAIKALIDLQPNFDQLLKLPRPNRLFRNAALDARCVEMAAKRLKAATA